MKITKQQLKQIIKEELEGVMESPPADNSTDAIGMQLDYMADRMLSAYTDEVPPALQEMIDLIEARDYDTIRSDHNRMWTDLVQYHRDNKKMVGGLTPRVSHNFRSIRTIVTNM
tara:strand:+ start:1425 stop:1766 length:342 start_codon:yes stop_codon:yes gene_type:complete